MTEINVTEAARQFVGVDENKKAATASTLAKLQMALAGIPITVTDEDLITVNSFILLARMEGPSYWQNAAGRSAAVVVKIPEAN